MYRNRETGRGEGRREEEEEKEEEKEKVMNFVRRGKESDLDQRRIRSLGPV